MQTPPVHHQCQSHVLSKHKDVARACSMEPGPFTAWHALRAGVQPGHLTNAYPFVSAIMYRALQLSG